MFKFLKEKLSQAVGLFSKKVEEEAEVEEIEKEEQKEIQKEEKAQVKQEKKVEAIEKKEHAIKKHAEPDKEEKTILDDGTAKDDDSEEDLLTDEDERISELERERLEKLEEEKAHAKAKLEQEKREVERKRLEEEQKKQAATAEAKRRKAEEERLEEERKEELKKSAEKAAADEKAREKKGFFAKLFGKKEEVAPKPKDDELKKLPKKLKAKLVLDEEEFKEEEAYLADEEEEFKKVDEEEKAFESSEKRIIDEEKKEREEIEEAQEKGFFDKIKEKLTTVKLSDDKFNDMFWELEVTMLENNVAVEVIEKIKEDLRHELTSGKVSRKSINEIVHDSLKKSIEGLFDDRKGFDLIETVKKSGSKPFVIAFIGVNGSGKTTTMAKIAHLLLKNKLSVVFAASDTFRAAAIQQLQEHADKLGVKMIKHDYESDPAAVAFDAVKHAKAKGIDVVLIDTAGRLHTNDNLMNELKKLIRVNKPDLKIFIGESITGNDCVEQAKLFNEAVGIDAIILAKADIDEKGGAALSVSYVTKKPIIYLGTGQTYNDLQKFDADLIVKNIGL